MGQDNLICPCSHPVHWNVDYIAHRTGKCILIYYITILIRNMNCQVIQSILELYAQYIVIYGQCGWQRRDGTIILIILSSLCRNVIPVRQ